MAQTVWYTDGSGMEQGNRAMTFMWKIENKNPAEPRSAIIVFQTEVIAVHHCAREILGQNVKQSSLTLLTQAVLTYGN